jgi:hypothetical protein
MNKNEILERKRELKAEIDTAFELLEKKSEKVSLLSYVLPSTSNIFKLVSKTKETPQSAITPLAGIIDALTANDSNVNKIVQSVDLGLKLIKTLNR